MIEKLKTAAKKTIRRLGFDIVHNCDPARAFHSDRYLRHNARRLEHLVSLGIPVAGMSVLDVGAGIGDHSHYYMDRGCKITITDARQENLDYLKKLYPGYSVQFLDLDSPSSVEGSPFDVVHCYGLLYHLNKPKQALEFLSKNTSKMLFLETCVSFGENEEMAITTEPSADPTQAFSGTGCLPTRAWLFNELQGLFEYVYLPTTQPWHEEFPLDWTAPEERETDIQRAIFIASREKLANERLTQSLVLHQMRHE